MKTRKGGAVLRQVNSLFNLGATRELTDGQLLERFATAPGEAGELAFAALVERHGAMVLRVCRARLTDPHDALDAFQATFLVLVRKARGLWVRDSLGPWLHQVAWRTATCAKVTAARRRRLERESVEAAALGKTTDAREPGWENVLHQEIDRLPERYRVPIVLCDLQGLSCEEAARRMGRPVGTVKCWRSRGRDRLRARLTRAGLAPAAGLATVLSTSAGEAPVPKAAQESLWAAARAAANGSTVGVIPASVAEIVNGVMKEMFMNTLRRTTACLLALAVVAAGLGAAARGGAKDETPPAEPADAQAAPALARADPPGETSRTPEHDLWPLTLHEALRLGLENADNVQGVRVEPNGLMAVEPASAPGGFQRLKSQLMSTARSVEQQYWALVQQQAQLRAFEKAVDLAQAAVHKASERAKAGGVKPAEVDEARQRLEQFRLDLVAKTSDVITTERQLRNLLGLHAADDRRILAVTSPTVVELKPDWNTSLRIMLQEHPDVARAWAGQPIDRLMAGAPKDANDAEFRLRSGFGTPAREHAWPGEGWDATTKAVIRLTTLSLSRAFMNLEANFLQFEVMTHHRAEAEIKLKALKQGYETGNASLGSYVDAVSLHTRLVAEEVQFRAAYNVSLVAFEEAQGTLLNHHNITVTAPLPTTTGVDGPDKKLAPPDRTPEPAGPGGKTFSFHFTVGTAPRPVEIRGSFTIAPAPAARAGKSP
ncbi:MAG: sigma-70 family RNA polymerase sigma factor [Isosphaeraceae bacterium]